MQLPDVSYDSLMKLFHTDVYGFPLFSLLMFAGAGAFLGGWYWKLGMKVEKRIAASNSSGLPSAAEFAETTPAQGERPNAEDEAPRPQPRFDGHSDLEGRLIDALITAVSHAQVNSGRLSLVIDPTAEKTISLAKSTIDFDLAPPKNITPPQANPPAEPEPPVPGVEEVTE